MYSDRRVLCQIDDVKLILIKPKEEKEVTKEDIENASLEFLTTLLEVKLQSLKG